MRRLIATLALLIFACGCGGSNSTTSDGGHSSQSLTEGPWEVSINGNTLIEADLLICQGGCGTVSTSNPPYLVGAVPGSGQPYQGLSPSNEAQALTLSGTIQGSSITLDFSETNCPCGAWGWHLVGTVGADGNSNSGTATFNGNAGGAGTFSGAAVTGTPALSYSGSITFFDANGSATGTNAVQAALVQGNASNGFAMTANFTLTGVDNGSYQFLGSQDGKTFLLTGVINGQSVSFVGYYDSSGTYTGTVGSLLVFQTQDPPVLDNGWFGISGILAAPQ
jgi:hypothetical protein